MSKFLVNLVRSSTGTTLRLTGACIALALCIGCLHGGPGQSDCAVDCDSTACSSDDCEACICLPMHRYSRCLDEHFASHEASRRAYASMQQCYPEPPNIDFQSGYRQAFVDVALGGDGVVPAVPPECYWSTCYRTAEGHQHAEDWFSGYTAGAERATAHCRYQFNRVASSGATPYHVEDDAANGIIRTHGSTEADWEPEVNTTW